MEPDHEWFCKRLLSFLLLRNPILCDSDILESRYRLSNSDRPRLLGHTRLIRYRLYDVECLVLHQPKFLNARF